MSQRAFSLPIRTLSVARPLNPQWVCRRCLATQSETSTTPIPPAAEVPDYDPSLPASQRTYRLNKTDFNLKKPLKQRKINDQYLRHSTSDLLHDNEKKLREKTVPHKKVIGVVVSAGKMQKTVKVRVAGQEWNKRIGKYYKSHEDYLTSDPNDSLVEGDVVELHRLKVSRHVRHVVASIVSPFGDPVESRPPVPTADERLAAYKGKRFAKLKRRELRVKAADGDAEAIQALKDMGLDPGAGAEAGVGKKENVQTGVGERRNPSSGAILGEKGQKLPQGVLPGGKHAVGGINERSQQRKGMADRRNEEAMERLQEGKEKKEELERMNLNSDSVLR